MPAGDNVVRLLPPLTVTDEEIRDGARPHPRSVAAAAKASRCRATLKQHRMTHASAISPTCPTVSGGRPARHLDDAVGSQGEL